MIVTNNIWSEFCHLQVTGRKYTLFISILLQKISLLLPRMIWQWKFGIWQLVKKSLNWLDTQVRLVLFGEKLFMHLYIPGRNLVCSWICFQLCSAFIFNLIAEFLILLCLLKIETLLDSRLKQNLPSLEPLQITF